ncbi:MAG: hypothetical protein DI524_09985 [Ectopseudomonas oleovorans]|nr:MAG: hypothetical protein DI524_09985 [Pseudomonas oleovorans]
MSATHPRVKDDHAAVIGLRTTPMGPDASWERPWGAPEQADEVLIARSHSHPLTPPAASRHGGGEQLTDRISRPCLKASLKMD